MPGQPNIVVFFTDQQRWDCSGLHGNPLDLMPNFDRLAQAGTHVANFFTCQPVCGPARACIQTGQYATVNGSYRNGIPLTKSVTAFGGAFQRRWLSHRIYWQVAPGAKLATVRSMRRIVADIVTGSPRTFSNSPRTTTTTALYNEDNAEVELPGYRSDAMVDAGIRYINEHKEEPFFLFMSFIEPHHQNHVDDYPAPDGYRERYANRWVPPDLAALGGSTQRQPGRILWHGQAS